MKNMTWHKKLVIVVAGALLALALNAPAQNSPTPAPNLPYGVSEVVKLAQANINDDTIIAYIKSNRTDYSLSADQLLYLRQQGVSEAVLKAMLTQPKPVVAPASAPAAAAATAPPPAAPAPAPAGRAVMSPTYTTPAPEPAPVAPPNNAVVVAPQVTYVQPAPAPYYYYPPYYYEPYPYYAWPFPPVSFSFGWGWHGHGRR